MVMTKNGELVCYTDGDLAKSRDKSSSYGSVLFNDEFTVAWKHQKQRLVALSTTEAEMIASIEAFKEKKCVHKLF